MNIINEAFDRFDARLEDLIWKEDSDGTLYAGDKRSFPDTVVSFTLTSAGLEAKEESVEPSEWRGYRTVSRPDMVSNNQFD